MTKTTQLLSLTAPEETNDLGTHHLKIARSAANILKKLKELGSQIEGYDELELHLSSIQGALKQVAQGEIQKVHFGIVGQIEKLHKGLEGIRPRVRSSATFYEDQSLDALHERCLEYVPVLKTVLRDFVDYSPKKKTKSAAR